MRVLTLLCFVGFAVASFNGVENRNSSVPQWMPGREYTYSYQGRILSGMPDLAPQYAGLGLKAILKVYVSSSSPSELSLKLVEPEFVQINKRLLPGGRVSGELEGLNWRNVELPPMAPIPSEASQFLMRPTKFTLEEGHFRTLTVSSDEPLWSINMKKGLVSLFQTTSPSSQPELRLENEIDDAGLTQGGIWSVQEQSLDGVCETNYQLIELPNYAANELPELKEKTAYELCMSSESKRIEDVRFFELIKEKNVERCQKRNTYTYYKPGNYHCDKTRGNCPGQLTRSSLTRYIVCRSHGYESESNTMTVVHVLNEGELSSDVIGYKTEQHLTGTMQTLSLIKIEHSDSLPQPQSPRTLHSLFYRYGMKEVMNENDVESLDDEIRYKIHEEEEYKSEEEKKWSSIHKLLSRGILDSDSLISSEDEEMPNNENIKRQVKILIKEVISDLISNRDLAEKQITMKALSAARSFVFLPETTIEELYEELKQELSSESEIFKNIFFDTLVMSGSADSIRFAMKKIRSGEVERTQISSIFMFLPQYVIVPNTQLLEEIRETVLCDQVQQSPARSYAIMSFSMLLQKACISENRKTSYPVDLLGQMCSPESSIVTEKWIPYLKQKVYQSSCPHERNICLISLGLMSHRSVAYTVLPLIEGKKLPSFEKSNPITQSPMMTRYLAIHSLAKVGKSHPSQVIPILVAVTSNRVESPEIRIAAFNILMRLNPSMSVFHKLASMTHSERDSELLKVINSAFYSMKENRFSFPVNVHSEEMGRKASLVYPLIKKVEPLYPSSSSLFTEDFLKELGVGYNDVFTWTSSKYSSFLPESIYIKLNYLMDRLHFSPAQIGIQFHGLGTIIDELYKIYYDAPVEPYSTQIPIKVKETISRELQQVFETLRVKTRQSIGLRGMVYSEVMENTPFFKSIESSSTEKIHEEIKKLLNDPTSYSKTSQFNFQRVINRSPSEYLVPSEIGLPIVIETHMPVVVSVSGSNNYDISRSSTSQIETAVKFVYASQLAGWVGTICPFTGEYVVAGLDEHSVINIPVVLKMKLDVLKHNVEISVSNMESSSSSGLFDVFHYHVRPFTVNEKYFSPRPMSLSPSMKIIRSQNPEKTIIKRFGQDNLGLDMKAIIKTESPYTNFNSLLTRLRWYKYNPLNLVHFSWIPTAMSGKQMPSNRMHELKIQYSPSQSSTKKIVLSVHVGFATKKMDEPVKVHSIKEDTQSRSMLKKLLPYKVVSRSIEKVQQSELRENLMSLISKTEIKNGGYVTIDTSLYFAGPRTNSKKLSLTACLGETESTKTVWAIELKDKQLQEIYMAKGSMKITPESYPEWNLEKIRETEPVLEFENILSAGSFQDSMKYGKIKMIGHATRTEEQKEFSRRSRQASELNHLLKKRTPLIQLSMLAGEVRRQASSLDKVNMEVRYEKVPSKIVNFSQWLIEALKTRYFTKISYQSGFASVGPLPESERLSVTDQINMNIKPGNASFDLTIMRQGGNRQLKSMIKFSDIRLPYPLTYVIPYSPLLKPVSSLSKGMTGKRLYPMCKEEMSYIRTFDNATVKINDPTCYHLLAADCGVTKQFAILIRSHSQEPSSPKDLKVYIGYTKLQMKSASDAEVQLLVNGTVKHVGFTWTPITESELNREIVFAKRTRDVLIIKSTPYSMGYGLEEIMFDGQKAEISVSNNMKSKICGLCGDSNGEKIADLRSPDLCTYSKPELFVATYRVPNVPESRCNPLPSTLKRKLEIESQQCATYQVVPTQIRLMTPYAPIIPEEVYTGIRSENTNLWVSRRSCIRHTHLILERSTDYCFSRKQVPECRSSCKPVEGEVQKRVSFICMPKDRISEHVAEKIRSGKSVKELEQMLETIKLPVMLPRTGRCIPM